MVQTVSALSPGSTRTQHNPATLAQSDAPEAVVLAIAAEDDLITIFKEK